MEQNRIERFVESLFDERIWQCDVEYQQAMVRLWIGMAYEEGAKKVHSSQSEMGGEHYITELGELKYRERICKIDN